MLSAPSQVLARPPTAGAEVVVDVPIVEMSPAPDNPRQSLGELDELIASIRAIGVLQPLLLVRLGDLPGYRIVCGERRWAAAFEAGLKVLPCIIRKLTEKERVEAMVVENLQRSNLTRVEEAMAFAQLIKLGYTQNDVARRVGKSQSYVCRRLLLLGLTPEVRDQVERREVPVEHALGYERPAVDAFAADEELHVAWLALRKEIIEMGDRHLIQRLRDFAAAHGRWRKLLHPLERESSPQD